MFKKKNKKAKNGKTAHLQAKYAKLRENEVKIRENGVKKGKNTRKMVQMHISRPKIRSGIDLNMF